jgi:GrpB-like predicted nucleotidyltransferase (UPF0157 family)
VSDRLDEHGWPLCVARGDRPWVEHTRTDEDGQEYNVHVRPREAAVENYLLLREYLRDHSDHRDEYAAVKRRAAERYPQDVGEYTRAKTDVIERAKEKARAAGYAAEIDL